jgi:hypothetical protein
MQRQSMKKTIFIIVFLCIITTLSAQSIIKLSIPDNIYINKIDNIDGGYIAATNFHLLKIKFESDYIKVDFLNTDLSSDEFTSILCLEESCLICCKNGVYQSNDLVDWEPLKDGIGNKSTVDLMLHNNNLYALTKASGLFQFSESVWIKKDSAWGSSWAYQLASHSDSIFVGTGEGVFYSTDNANIFNTLNEGLNYTVKSIYADDDYLHAGTSGHGFYTYYFFEDSWERESDNIGNIDVNSITTVDGRAIIGCEPNEEGYALFWSDNGYDWQPYYFSEFFNETVKYVYKLDSEPYLLVSTDNGTYLLDPKVTAVDENATSDCIVYPNPAKNRLNISLAEKFSGEAQLEIFDQIGNLIGSTNSLQLSQGNASLDIDKYNLKSGLYFCKLRYSSYLHTFKFTVIK